jgi:hypothetical protein
MLLKLLKYELKSTGSRFLVAFAVYIGAFAVLFAFFRDNVILVTMFTASGLIALVAITMLTMFQRYNTNLYGNEGYLMFTLPVKGRELLLSKLISTLIWMIALSIVGIASMVCFAFAYGHIESFNLDVFAQALLNNWPYFLLLAFEYFLSTLLTIISIYTSISVSKLPIWRKFGVLMGLVTYFVISFLQGVPIFIMGYFKLINVTMHIEGLSFIKDTYVSSVIWIQTGFIIIFCVGLFFGISYLFEKRISLK